MFNTKSLDIKMTFLYATMEILQVGKIMSGFVKKYFTKPFWINYKVMRHPQKLISKCIYLHTGLISSIWERGSKNGGMSLRMSWKPTTIGKNCDESMPQLMGEIQAMTTIKHSSRWYEIQGKNRREFLWSKI